MKLKFLCPSIKVYLNQTISIWYCQWLFGAISVLLSYTVATEMTWPQKPIVFTLWPLIKKVCWPLISSNAKLGDKLHISIRI